MDELQALKEQMVEISRELHTLWREDKVNYARIGSLENKLTLVSYRYAMKRDAMKETKAIEGPQVKKEKKKVFIFRRLRGALMGA